MLQETTSALAYSPTFAGQFEANRVMFAHTTISLLLCFSMCFVAQVQPVEPHALEPYPLPPKVRDALIELAGQCDVLILGEIHGTKEVPAVAAGLLQPLSKQGYGVLALEIPADQQKSLTDWATGRNERVPSFFAKPIADGRGSIQVLSLIRTALSPPFCWQLICFDQTSADSKAELNELFEKGILKKSIASDEDLIAASVRRDVRMAANFSNERARRAPKAKVLAICGNLHARTFNVSSADDPLSRLWPSFAAELANSHPTWRVRSVNVVPHSGGFFAMMAVEGEDRPTGGKVHTIRATRQLEDAEACALNDACWDWRLNLPRATPATFLAVPSADRLSVL